MVPEDDQGYTYDCWLFAPKEWFEAYGHAVDWRAAFLAVKGREYADPGEPATFGECKQAIEAMARQVGVGLTWLGDAFVRDLATVDQAVRDGWCVVVGVDEAAITGGPTLYHFEDLVGISGDRFVTSDSYRREDGAPRLVPIDTMHRAIVRNFDAEVCAIAFKIDA